MINKETLFSYRLKQAEETLSDAKKMLDDNLSPRSVINRAYYAVFYSILALFLKFDIELKTSKHSAIISIFDKEFVHTVKFDKSYSKILHKLFDARQENDYREFAVCSNEDAEDAFHMAEKFLKHIVTVLNS